MKRLLLVPTVIVVLGVGVAGCAGLRSERQGRDVGRAICDIKKADNADEAQRALDKFNRRAEKAQRIIGRPITEDVKDIQNNLNDLVTHASQNQDNLAQQDVAVIRRNVQTVSNQGPELVRRFYQGVSEGLGDCT
jgi:cob(I)alamin adenosyltransferase